MTAPGTRRWRWRRHRPRARWRSPRMRSRPARVCLRSSRIRSRHGCNGEGRRDRQAAPASTVDADQVGAATPIKAICNSCATIRVKQRHGATSAAAARTTASRQRTQVAAASPLSMAATPARARSGPTKEAGPYCVAGSPNGSHGGGAANPPDHAGSRRCSPVRRNARITASATSAKQAGHGNRRIARQPRHRCARPAIASESVAWVQPMPAARASAGSRPSSA